jgi:hypothetical protein
MGLNWCNSLPADKLSHATSLAQWRPSLDKAGRELFLINWLKKLADWHEAIAVEPETAFERLRRAVEARLWRLGEPVRLEHTEFGPMTGTLVGLGPGAAALVQRGAGPPIRVHCGRQI